MAEHAAGVTTRLAGQNSTCRSSSCRPVCLSTRVYSMSAPRTVYSCALCVSAPNPAPPPASWAFVGRIIGITGNFGLRCCHD